MLKVEEVAAALVRSRNGGECNVVDWAAEARDNQTIAQAWEDARAAIEAMRGPTPGMLIEAGTMEGYSEAESCSLGGPDADHVAWWDAMIDAALKEGE